MLALLLTHVAALALFWYAPRFWVKKDVAVFAADGAADSLHGKFHRQRLTWRIALTVVVAALASVPLLPGGWSFASSFLALANVGVAYFFYDFNSRLSRARGLPEYYVSFDPRAALFPDRWLADKAKAWWASRGGAVSCTCEGCASSQQGYAARLLERLTVQVLEGGALAYLLLFSLALFLHFTS